MYGYEIGYVNQFFNIFDFRRNREDIFEDNFFEEDLRSDLLKPKILRIALQIVGIISIVFINVATLGFFTVFGAALQRIKIHNIQKNKFLNTLNKDQFHQWIPPLSNCRKNVPISNEFSKKMDGFHEMGELISASLEWAFNDIQQSKPIAFLNKSKSILKQSKGKYLYHSNMNAVHCWMVYLMIKNAGLEYACDQTTLFVKLNNTLKVSSSKTCQVKYKNKIRVFYPHKDEWTPPNESFYFGVDPVSVKLILEELKFNQGAINQLELLLLQGLISDSNQDLNSIKKNINADIQNNIHVKNAYVLIHEIASVLEEKYHSELIAKWEKLTDNQLENPAPAKKIYLPERKFEQELNLFFLKQMRLRDKIIAISTKIFVSIGIIFFNIITLGSITFICCVYQNKEINILREKLLKNQKSINSIFIKEKYDKSKSDLKYIRGDSKGLKALYKNIKVHDYTNTDQEMDALMQEAFKNSFNELLELSKKTKYDLVFNKSSKILHQHQVLEHWVDVYADNKNAVYLWMIYKLILQAALKKKNDDYALIFSKNLSVCNSRPCHIPKDEEHNDEFFFLNQDSWTPKNNISLYGVEPVSIKWLLEKIKKNSSELELLEILLLKALIPENSKILKSAICQSNNSWHDLKHVFLAYELIENLAIVVSDNFKNSFFNMWDELTEDCSEEPLSKLADSASIKLTGQEKKWEIPSIIIRENLYSAILKTQKLISPIWDDIHKYRINKNIRKIRNLPLEFREALKYLSSQYYWNHDDINQVGCLFSSLTIHLLQSKGSISAMNPQDITATLAEYLNDLLRKKANSTLTENEKENYCFFEIEIPQATKQQLHQYSGWTIQEYIHWLRTSESPIGKGNRNHYDMGDLEIELFVKVFNIGIQVFISGQEYRLDNGLMMPLKVFGPNTKEKFILYNSPGFSFLPLMPKLKRLNEIEDNIETSSDIKSVEKFWKKISW